MNQRRTGQPESPRDNRSVAIKALLAQLAGIAGLWALGQGGGLPGLTPFALAATHGVLAASAALLLRADRWWIPIHLGFAPLLVATQTLGIPPWVYLAGFLGLAMIYWTSFRTQVPLFLSGLPTVHRLAAFLPDERPLKVLDLGSGTGSVVRRLALLRPDWRMTGIETAPGPYHLSRWLARRQPRVRLIRGDFWQHSLADYDVVYAFLSPVPMTALWQKARLEMRPGSWLISNTFPVAGLKPDCILPVTSKVARHLYCYRLTEKQRSPGQSLSNLH